MRAADFIATSMLRELYYLLIVEVESHTTGCSIYEEIISPCTRRLFGFQFSLDFKILRAELPEPLELIMEE